MYQSIKAAIGDSKVNRFHLLLTAMCMFLIIADGYDLVIYGSIKHGLIEEWNLDNVTAGLIGSAALVGMMIGSFALGILADILGRKPVLIFCFCLFCIATGVSGLIHTPLLFTTFRFLAGIGIGGAMPNAIGLLSDYIPRSHKNTFIAIAMAGMQVGGIIAPLLALYVGPDGWRECLWLAFLPLVVLPFLFTHLPNSIDYYVKRGKKAELLKVLRQAAPQLTPTEEGLSALQTPGKEHFPLNDLFTEGRAGNTFLFWTAFFMGLLMIYGLNTWLPDLMQGAGYELGSSLTFLLTLNLAALIGSFFLGRVADSINTKHLLVALYIVGAISMIMLAFFKNNIVAAYILISICGICAKCPQNIGTAYVSSFYGSKIRSTGLGVCNTVGRIGGAMGPTLGGILMTAALPMYLNCVAFAIPGVIAAAAYGFSKSSHKAEEK